MSKQLKVTTLGEHAGTARFHAYNVGLAIDLNDTIAAIVFHHIHMNIERLVENSHVDDDGVAWLTVSKTGIMRFMPEFTKSQIETAINRLTENGLLSKKVSNRKNSYTLTDIGWSYYPLLAEEGQIKAPKAEVKKDAEEADKAAAETRSDDVISVSDNVKQIIDYVNKKAGKCFNYANSYVKNISELFAAGYSKEDMLAVVDRRFEDLSGTKEFNAQMNPSKLFFIKTFPNYLKDAKGSDITMTPGQLERDAEEKEVYHLREAEKCKCQRLILETEADNLPFDFTEETPQDMIKNNAKRERYHLNEANKFANMKKFIQSVKE